jgi:Domain of unknown function (DUF4123)
MTLGQFLLTEPEAKNASSPSASPTWFALLDVAAFKSADKAVASIASIAQPPTKWINLYADMDGLQLQVEGPRLVPLLELNTKVLGFTLNAELARGVSFVQIAVSPGELEAHLLELREVKLPDGSGALFRFQDPRVMAALMPILQPKQQSALLGPITNWRCLDPCGRMFFATQNPETKSSGAFALNKAQLASVDQALLPYEVLAQTREADSAVLLKLNPCQQLETSRFHVSNARTYGLRADSDVSLYCVLAFQLPEGFADQTPFSTAIEQAQSGRQTFSQGLDRADPREWKKWNDLLAKQDGM